MEYGDSGLTQSLFSCKIVCVNLGMVTGFLVKDKGLQE